MKLKYILICCLLVLIVILGFIFKGKGGGDLSNPISIKPFDGSLNGTSSSSVFTP